jgi:calcineurin-like phosphoesterase family protein
MIFYISDTHFGHKNAIKYDQRPFFTVSEMDNAMIENWNRVVSPEDTVYHLGDFCFGKKDEWLRIVKQLNGKKILIVGNHDRERMNKEIAGSFYAVRDYKEVFDNGCMVILCHYPILSYRNSYDLDYWMLHGHVHNTTKEAKLVNKWVHELRTEKKTSADSWGHIVNVGCMMPYMDYTPRTLEEIQRWYFGEGAIWDEENHQQQGL